MARKKTSIRNVSRQSSSIAARIVKEALDEADSTPVNLNDSSQFLSSDDYKDIPLCRTAVPGISKNGKPAIVHFTLPTVNQVDALALAADQPAQLAASLQLLVDCLKNPDGTPAFESIEELRRCMSFKRVLLIASALSSDSSVEVEKNV